MATPKVRLVSGPVLSVDYTPSGATTGGAVVSLAGGVAAFAERDIAAGVMGSIAWSGGIWAGQKITGAFVIADAVYYNSTGDPNTGTAGTGAFTNVPAAGYQFVGYCTKTAASADDEVQFVKTHPIPTFGVATVAVGGTAQANANAVTEGFTVVTGADNTAAVKLPSARAGMVCVIKSTTSGKVLQVFPATADKINGAAANAVYNMANLSQRMFVARDDTDWYTAPETIT